MTSKLFDLAEMLPFVIAAAVSLLTVGTAAGMEYVGATAPGAATSKKHDNRLSLENGAIRFELSIDSGKATGWSVENRATRQRVSVNAGHLPKIVLADGRTIDLSAVKPANGFDCVAIKAETGPRGESAFEGRAISAEFTDAASGLKIAWSVALRRESNYVTQTLDISTEKDAPITSLVFLASAVKNARQVGQVAGSVVVTGDIFLAIEHPLADNRVTPGDPCPQVCCSLPRGNTLRAGQTWRYKSVVGVAAPGQLRRGFLYYLERRRAHPYRPFLHYNNWYDVVLARREQRIREPECLEAIEIFGRELVRKRGVKLDALVWDDGWDDLNSLWSFHKGFPEGFRNLQAAAGKYGAAQGVWMSPWGGYASAKSRRIAYGKSQGYETNASGFSMAGAKYGKAFRDMCLKMIRDNGVTFFKFDGMGGGNHASGAKSELPDDIDAVLDLTRVLRREKPAVFISATVGTWASPFWTLYADSIWRQGGDTGYFGKGDTRQQWITYRDMFCHDRIVKLGPLYPLNSLMLHGVCISKRRAPAKMAHNEKSIADEIWTFFGSGTHLQELYTSPNILTDETWDTLAAAAKWSRANSDMLVDTHWIGGNTGKGEVYGWASWRPGKGVLTLLNPSDKPQEFSITAKAALELPDSVKADMTLRAVYPGDQRLPGKTVSVDQSMTLTLSPFEVVVMEFTDPNTRRRSRDRSD